MANIELSSLLPSGPFLLSYSLLLFIPSLVLTFAGAFLTLDRTRSFVPINDPFIIPKSNTNVLIPFFRGGVGGIIAGYAFGLHLSTFLSLLIPSLTKANPLTPAAFLAVWVLSSLLTAVIAGRWKCVAFAAAGVTGGTTLALTLSVIIHPSLVTRVIFVTVSFSVFTVLTILPIHRFQYTFIRIAMSATGSFGLVLSIGILAGIPAWSNVWQRLWISDSLAWGTAKEKGLSVGFCLFLGVGIACDWLLKRTFGENPDQKWDSYLANYVANLPSADDRAGSFQPFTSRWSKWFGHPHPASPHTPIPACHDIKQNFDPIQPEKTRLRTVENTPRTLKYGKELGFLRKAKHHVFHRSQMPRNKSVVKFQPLDDNELSSSESDSDLSDVKLKASLESPAATYVKPWLASRPSIGSMTTYSTDSTLFGDDHCGLRIKVADEFDRTDREKAMLFAPEQHLYYMDYLHKEDGIGQTTIPPFAGQQHEPSKDDKDDKDSRGSASTRSPPGAVPITPSLIDALDRIAAAHEQAYGPSVSYASSDSATHVVCDGLPPAKHENRHYGLQWDEFWEDVNDRMKQ